MKALRKAELALTAEMNKQLTIMYCSTAVILWRDYGWRKLRIGRRFSTTQKVWDECANWGYEKSMLQMLEEETGIEMQLSGFDKSYHELAYMDEKAWNRKLLTLPQVIYMHQQQRKWMAPLILACICLSLHRDEHWGADRISWFIQQIDAVRQQLGENPKKYMELMEHETDLRRTDIWADGKV